MFFRLNDSSLPYFLAKAKSGKLLKILIDTGSNQNYIQPQLVDKPIPNKNPFSVSSIGGDVLITHHTNTNLDGLKIPINFFILSSLNSFDAILGNDSLKELNAIMHVREQVLATKKLL